MYTHTHTWGAGSRKENFIVLQDFNFCWRNLSFLCYGWVCNHLLCPYLSHCQLMEPSLVFVCFVYLRQGLLNNNSGTWFVDQMCLELRSACISLLSAGINCFFFVLFCLFVCLVFWLLLCRPAATIWMGYLEYGVILCYFNSRGRFVKISHNRDVFNQPCFIQSLSYKKGNQVA